MALLPIASRNTAGAPATRGKGLNDDNLYGKVGLAGPKAAKAAVPKKGAASAAPVARAAAAKAATVAASAPSSADLIAQYSIARAKILQAMAPQVQGFYQNADSALQRDVGSLTSDMRSRLFDAGNQESAALGKQLGDLAGPLGSNVTPSFNADAAANAAQALGAAFPGESLQKQGAAFASAAAFAPERALAEGQYAITAAAQAAGVTAAKAAAISPSVSKLLGYVAKADGSPVLGANGKPIPIPKSGGMTDYQAQELKLRQRQIADSEANANRRIGLQAAGLTFRTEKANADYQAAVAKGARPNAALSAKYGYIVDSNGRAILNAKGRHIPVAKTKTAAAGKPRTINQDKTLDALAQAWYTGKPVTITTASTLNPKTGQFMLGGKSTKIVGKLNYQAALRKLQKQYGLKLADAQTILDSYYKPGERGRPWMNYQDRSYLLGIGFPKALVTRLQNSASAFKKFEKLLADNNLTSVTGITGRWNAQDVALFRRYGIL